jgi:hypothetical protein
MKGSGLTRHDPKPANRGTPPCSDLPKPLKLILVVGSGLSYEFKHVEMLTAKYIHIKVKRLKYSVQFAAEQRT